MPETPEAQALLKVRADLEAGNVKMSRELMIRLIESMDNLRMGSFGWNEWDMQMVDDRWRQDWVLRATPEWLDVLTEILIDPTRRLRPDTRVEHDFFNLDFQMLFKEIALRFPTKALECVELLLKDEATHPQLAQLLFTE